MKSWRSSFSPKTLLIPSVVTTLPIVLVVLLAITSSLVTNRLPVFANDSLQTATGFATDAPSGDSPAGDFSGHQGRIRHANGQGQAMLGLPAAHQVENKTYQLSPRATHQRESTANKQVPGLSLRTTAGLDEHQCAEEPVLGVPANTQVVYCYFVTNTGTEPIDFHSIEDSELGVILSAVQFPLGVGAPALVTTTAVITQTTVNVGTWSGLDGSGTVRVSASASAKVYVNPLRVDAGVVNDNGGCSQQPEVGASEGTQLELCYMLTNNTDLPLVKHKLTASNVGVLVESLNFTLQPGASVTSRELGLSISETISTTANYTLTWSAETTVLPSEVVPQASNAGPITFSSQDSIDVLVPTLAGKLTVGLESGVCADTTELTVFEGTEIVFCYFARNTGGLTLTHHTVTDDFPVVLAQVEETSSTPKRSSERVIVENTFYEMGADISGQFTNSQTAITSTTTTMLWTGFSDDVVLASSVISASASSQVTITVLPLARVQVLIYEDSNENGQFDDGESGIAGAEVSLVAEDADTTDDDPLRTISDADGNAIFEGIQPNVYETIVRFPNPLLPFEPISGGITQTLLRGGSNEEISLGFRRTSNELSIVYIPYR